MPKTTLLAIETSCDETGVAIVEREGSAIRVLASQLASQMNIHAATGGVIPEVAAREHVAALQPMIKQVIAASGRTPEQLDAIAVTVGPGLQPALSVGVNAARTLAYAWDKPLIPVQHLEGHVYSALLQHEAGEKNATQFTVPADDEIFPALALIVSGGHTQLIVMHSHVAYEVVGSTKDDAAGEAFDKVARLVGLPYPGGPAISALARTGNPQGFAFSVPMAGSQDLNFSFSGLKTAVLYAWRELSSTEQAERKADIVASFQHTVVAALALKTAQAMAEYEPKVLLLAGGVAANTALQEKLTALAQEQGVPLRIASGYLTGDNAVMIGLAALFAYEQKRFISWQQIDATARLPIGAFQPQ